MAVFVLDKHKNLLMPTSEKRARLLLEKGRAVLIKMYPFTIRLKDRVGGALQQVQIKIDHDFKHIGTAERIILGINHKYCTLISRNDGYDYKV